LALARYLNETKAKVCFMTYRGILTVLLGCTLICLMMMFASSQTGPIISAVARDLPEAVGTSVHQDYLASGESYYFVSNGHQAVVRDPTGNLHVLPVSAVPR
jgi:hypothetical protein